MNVYGSFAFSILRCQKLSDTPPVADSPFTDNTVESKPAGQELDFVYDGYTH